MQRRCERSWDPVDDSRMLSQYWTEIHDERGVRIDVCVCVCVCVRACVCVCFATPGTSLRVCIAYYLQCTLVSGALARQHGQLDIL